MLGKGDAMLALAVRNTAKLVRAKSKSDNVRLGRFFTKRDTARLMANMLMLDEERGAYTVLDPGAGTGILSAALVEEICRRAPKCKRIFLTCYETDPEFLPVLYDNLERIRRKARHDYDVKLYVTVYEENYITDSRNHYTVTLFDTVEEKFDLIICNPPSGLIGKGSDEAERAGGVTQLKIDSSLLFAKMAARHLEDGGQLVIVLPTTVASASALREFRREMAATLSVEKIHLFVGKSKNGSRAVPLKKNFILCYGKGERPITVTVTTSTDDGRPENTVMLPPLEYNFVVYPEDGSLTLPKSTEDTNIVKYLSAFPETLTTLGLKISTGLVIDSKCRGMLTDTPAEGAVPVIRQNTITNGQVRFPSGDGYQYIRADSTSLVQKNKNMLIIKRIPAKSDKRFVNAAVYMASQLADYGYISTHNKVNFIDTKDKSGEICARLAFGLYALLNSTIYDRYLSIVSKSKQINAKELRSLPLPPRNIIENMGMRLLAVRDLSVAACDEIVNPTLHIRTK